MKTTQAAGLALATFAFMLSMTVSTRADSQQRDYSKETYRVDFMPWANRKLAFRTPDGQWIGYSTGGVKLEMLIDGNTYRAAVTPDGIDVVKLLSSLSPRRGTDGSLYFTMKIMQDTKLEDGRILPASTASQPTEVLLDVNDFYITKTLQPVDSETSSPNAPPPQVSARDRFNNTLEQEGVTAATRPTDPAHADDGSEDTALPDQTDNQDDDGSDAPLSFFTPGGIVTRQLRGNPFPQKIFSSPVCSCAGGSCGISSSFGTRERFRTKNGKYGSHFHKGLDINTAAHRSGTPVVAAADGCLKVPKKVGTKPRRRGEPVAKNDLYEAGYGYTVRLTHGNGFETQYSHLKSLAPGIKWGACFKRGERLGSMGETGNATGPHLHFGVARDRRMVDPRSYMLGSSGSFYSQSCANQPKYAELDREMRNDLRAGLTTASAGGASAARAVR